MNELHDQLFDLVRRAKQCRNTFPNLVTLDSLPAITLADDLARIGGELVALSVKIKQAARTEADERVKGRRLWSPPKMTAERAAEALRKRGGYSVTP